ncbi:unnamed protein product [Clonostachys rosea f. rosea IK726]|uniref:Uncharacterized protein n=1 Tax=Clonostachys rosea f. rosea IK726 TaxID=1349383 RepID=A0ACA9TMF8_BIOOC|nr:unnamed protein product [Clonostachys rosea f. rosea IK726]
MVSFEPRNGSFEPANRSLAPRRFDQTPSKHDRSVSNFTPPDVYMNTCKDAPAAGSICLRSPQQPNGRWRGHPNKGSALLVQRVAHQH